MLLINPHYTEKLQYRRSKLSQWDGVRSVSQGSQMYFWCTQIFLLLNKRSKNQHIFSTYVGGVKAWHTCMSIFVLSIENVCFLWTVWLITSPVHLGLAHLAWPITTFPDVSQSLGESGVINMMKLISKSTEELQSRALTICECSFSWRFIWNDNVALTKINADLMVTGMDYMTHASFERKWMGTNGCLEGQTKDVQIYVTAAFVTSFDKRRMEQEDGKKAAQCSWVMLHHRGGYWH